MRVRGGGLVVGWRWTRVRGTVWFNGWSTRAWMENGHGHKNVEYVGKEKLTSRGEMTGRDSIFV
jgi:hypothetical protein